MPRKSVVRLTDRPDMTKAVYRGRKTTTTTGNSWRAPQNYKIAINLKKYDQRYMRYSSPKIYEGISKSFEPNMERARNLDLFCFIFQRSPLPTPHTCPI